MGEYGEKSVASAGRVGVTCVELVETSDVSRPSGFPIEQVYVTFGTN